MGSSTQIDQSDFSFLGLPFTRGRVRAELGGGHVLSEAHLWSFL